VFSHIYQSNLSPSKVAGHRARAARYELAADNFSMKESTRNKKVGKKIFKMQKVNI
jgi:hypothetical protein